jgi:catechol 2,3-dioxygenase-like lactoylglutathione lyase family enzyme
MLRDAPFFPYVPAKDLERARRFYEETLGLAPGEEFAAGFVYKCAGDTTFYLYESEGAGTSKASVAFFKVGSVEGEKAELEGRGVTFEEYDMPGVKTVNGIVTGGGAKAAWFKDSEGNILAIVADA